MRLFILSVLVIALALALYAIGPREMKRLPDHFHGPILALELVQSPDDFKLMVDQETVAPPGKSARSLYTWNTWVDFLFIAAYGTLWAAIARRNRVSALAALGTVL